ncbi:tRNA (guanosine(37)-N1)-methyltransferase TrmD [Candidatus Mycoplasma haematohominis]|uniref:tRNA (guanosine(37)-N1)-methyltransferase TrmD n=1 Tax=Candidatus Mycoplasma haematohominis TaxID=1494318 RepID=UPI001C0A75CF|nr:tRNA (guanosine(37)-N1)-methyltransferase TrmD [Candidatus Mycoplasma haemohominis]
MKFTILTIFPSSLESYINSSIIQKASKKGLIEIEVINIRKKPWQQVDDYAYGGKSGMVLKIEPIVEALKEHQLLDKHIVLLTPTGTTLKQSLIKDLVKHKHIVMICGHYEGIDARIENYISQEISIGDYVLTSGELGAMVLLDSITRLVPNVINQESLQTESFDCDLLDFPVYTRPQEFDGHKVPDIYLNGNHKEIEKFRLREQERITKEKRPDLYNKYIDKKRKNLKYKNS